MHGRVQLNHVGLDLAAVRVAGGIRASHAVLTRIVLEGQIPEGVLFGRSDGHVRTARADTVMYTDLGVLGTEETQESRFNGGGSWSVWRSRMGSGVRGRWTQRR